MQRMFRKLAYYDFQRHFEYSEIQRVRETGLWRQFFLIGSQPSLLFFPFISATPPGWLDGQFTFHGYLFDMGRGGSSWYGM